MTRPKAPASKSPHLSVAVTQSQLDVWNQAAERGGVKLSAWVRFTLDDAADEALLESKGKRLSNEELRKHVDRFTRRMNILLDKRTDRPG